MMVSQLMIYDDACAYCRGFAGLVRLLDRRKAISAIPFDAAESQALLRAQFGDSYGFAMYLFEGGEVSWGAEAARRIAESVSLPRWMAKLAFYLYPLLVKLVSKLTRRTRAVCGPECAGFANQPPGRAFIKIQKGALHELQRMLATHALQSSSIPRREVYR